MRNEEPSITKMFDGDLLMNRNNAADGENNHAVNPPLINNGQPLQIHHIMSPEIEISYFLERQRFLAASSASPTSGTAVVADDSASSSVPKFIRNPIGTRFVPLCGGCCLLAPGAESNWCCLAVMVVGVTVLFCVFVPEQNEIWSRVVACVLAAICIFLMVTCSLMDPGILLPRREDEALLTGSVQVGLAQSGATQTLEVCRTCQILRPPRSSHCPRADVCIAEYDHFCGVTGTVVGKRTQRFFVLQIAAYSLFAAFIGVRAAFGAAHANFGDNMILRGILSVLLCIAGIVVALWVGLGVSMTYCCLAAHGITMKDRVRRQFLREEDLECSCGTWVRTLCGPLPESNLLPEMEWHDVV